MFVAENDPKAAEAIDAALERARKRALAMIETSKGNIAELEDLIEDIYGRFPFEDILAATNKHIALKLRNNDLKPEYREKLEKYTNFTTFGMAREFSLDDN